MIKDGGLNFKTKLEIEFLPLNNGKKKYLEKSLTITNAKVTKKIKPCLEPYQTSFMELFCKIN